MVRIRFLLLTALAVAALVGWGCDGGSPVGGNGGQMPKDDDVSKSPLVDTRWKLTEVSLYVDYERTEVFDYSERNIIFEFRGDGILIITGNTAGLEVFDDELKNGEYLYEGGWPMVGCESCLPGPNLGINNLGYKFPEPAGLSLIYYLHLYDDFMIMIEDPLRKVTEKTGLSVGGDYYRWSGTFIKLM